MTIDEAIKHAEEEENECKDCAEEHRQLAGWLKELKQLREQKHCEDAVSREQVQNLIAELLSEYLHEEDRTKIENMDAEIGGLPPVTPTTCIATVKFSKEDIQELVNEKMKEIVVERKKGKWVNIHYKDEWYGDQFRCSLCGGVTIDNGLYCPNCGSFMRGEEDD